jgi:hypothetical protein
VFIWDLEKGTKVSTMRDEHIFGLKMRFLPGNKLLAIGGGFSFVLWDVPSGTKKAVLREGTSIKDSDSMIYDFAVTEDGTVFIFRWDGSLQRWAVKE